MNRKQHDGGNAQVFRITGARQGLAEDVRGRQRRYIISMSLRTVSVILAVTLWNVERHVAIVALVLGAVLPYISVVIANAGRENAPSLPSTFVTAPTRLGAPPTLSAVGEIAPPQAGADASPAGGDGGVDGFAESVPEDVTTDPSAGMRGEPRERP